MLEQAAREWPIDLHRSFFVGDKDDDMAAAAAFNIRGIKFDSKVDSLMDVVRRELMANANRDRQPSPARPERVKNGRRRCRRISQLFAIFLVDANYPLARNFLAGNSVP